MEELKNTIAQTPANQVIPPPLPQFSLDFTTPATVERMVSALIEPPRRMAWMYGVKNSFLQKAKLIRVHSVHPCRLAFGKVNLCLENYSGGPGFADITERMRLWGKMGPVYIRYHITSLTDERCAFRAEISVPAGNGKLEKIKNNLLLFLLKWLLPKALVPYERFCKPHRIRLTPLNEESKNNHF